MHSSINEIFVECNLVGTVIGAGDTEINKIGKNHAFVEYICRQMRQKITK